MAYKISSDDPDIIMMKEMFGDDLDVFHPKHKRMSIPGYGPLKWDQLNMFSGSMLNQYLNHCEQQCQYLLKWQGSNFDEVTQLIPKLKGKSQEDRELAEVLKFTTDSMKYFESSLMSNADIELAEMLEMSPLDLAIMNSSAAWSALAEYCVEKKIFAAVTKNITSDAKVKKHHFLAVVAAHLTKYVSKHFRAHDLSHPTQFLPLIYMLVQDAEAAQALEKGETKDKKKGKKRQVESPDQFLMNKFAKKNKDEPNLTPETIKLVFLKGWLYHYTSGDKEYEQYQFISTIAEDFGLTLSDISDTSGINHVHRKTISRWLTKIKKPGVLLADYKNEPVPELE